MVLSSITKSTKDKQMIEVSRNEVKLMHERDKYKSYLYTSLIGMYVLITILYFALIDVHNLDKKYKKSQEDLATLTIQTLEYKMLLAENEELLRIRVDLQKVLP